MANYLSVNKTKNSGSPFELSNRGSNNAEILTASDSYLIELGSDLVAADTIDIAPLIPKGCKLIGAELYSNVGLGGAAEFQLGVKANDDSSFAADDPDAFITSAVLGAGAANVELDNFEFKGIGFSDDLELFITVVAPTVVAADAELKVIVYYINE